MNGTFLLRLTLAACAVVLGTAGAGADETSAWDGDSHSAARLIAGTDTGGIRHVGLEIRLKPGWHTYWRYPGDAGVPPQFDFKASQNVKDVTVLWPAPERLSEGGNTSIGYARDLLFPLHVVAQDAAKPVMLRLKLDYGVCEKQCVPAVAKVELVLSKVQSALPQGASAHDATLVTAEAKVPKRVAVGEGGTLSIRAVRREVASPRPRVLVDIAGPAGVDLFAEGPTAQWALPVPERVDGAPAGLQRFAFELDGLPPGASDRNAQITLTAVAPNGEAIEVVTRLD
jgi:DsbC/DsbD-like thiol-disulfide interchange protein